MIKEGPSGELGSSTCRYTEAYNSTVCSEHLDDRGETEKLILGLEPLKKKKNPFFLVPYLWEGEIFIKGLWFLL